MKSEPDVSSDTRSTADRFENELREMYWIERSQIRAMSKMIRIATSYPLVKALEDHLTETEDHASRILQVFASLGKKPGTKAAQVMAGFLDEKLAAIRAIDPGNNRERAIIAASLETETYEIQRYASLQKLASSLGLHRALTLLKQSLEEEKETHERLEKLMS